MPNLLVELVILINELVLSNHISSCEAFTTNIALMIFSQHGVLYTIYNKIYLSRISWIGAFVCLTRHSACCLVPYQPNWCLHATYTRKVYLVLLVVKEWIITTYYAVVKLVLFHGVKCRVIVTISQNFDTFILYSSGEKKISDKISL